MHLINNTRNILLIQNEIHLILTNKLSNILKRSETGTCTLEEKGWALVGLREFLHSNSSLL